MHGDPIDHAAMGGSLRPRRILVAALNLISLALLAVLMLRVLGGDDLSIPAACFLVLFLLGLPWSLLGFWNAVIGLIISRLVTNPAAYTNPALARTPPDLPITAKIAVCLAIRHEAVAPCFARLEAMIIAIEQTDAAAQFTFHILSDSQDPESIAAEAAAVQQLQARRSRPDMITYRRRAMNTGFKAGNLRDFAIQACDTHDYMIVLDADSMMSAEAMLRLARVMQANDRLGILQSLVVGRPASSGFARIFQFGMRHAMRMQTIGTAWWQGPSGPYWGHNAIIRLRAFVDHCDLPVIPGKGPLRGELLSHDQVEAVQMRIAGYEVRVIADEFGSSEENPPDILEFIKRDLRWCQGNLQYVHLLRWPGLQPMGRFQLINAIMMYVGAPMNILMLVAGLGMAFTGIGHGFATGLAFALYLIVMAMIFAPRLLGVIDVLLHPHEVRRYGGAKRLLAGTVADLVFSLFLGAAMLVVQTVFIVRLLAGREAGWQAPNRAMRRLGAAVFWRALWPVMLYGIAAGAALAAIAPGALPWSVPMIGPCLLVMPFAILSARPRIGAWLARHRVCAIPEDFTARP